MTWNSFSKPSPDIVTLNSVKAETLKPLITKPSRQGVEKRAAFLKERIYGSVTLMAVNVGLLFQPRLTVDHAFVIIISTTLGIWLASMFSAVMAYRLTHNKKMQLDQIIHELAIHRGLLLAGLPSIIMLSLAALEFIHLRTAILADITLAVVGMTVAILRSAKTSTNTLQTALISFAFQAAVAAGIILIKFGAE